MKKILFYGVAVIALAAFYQTHAVTISPNLPGMPASGSTTSPGDYINGFYRLALFAGGILAFGAIVYGGILYAISGAYPSGASEAKEWIKGALLGLLLLAGAWIILYTINPNLVNLNLPGLSATGS